MEKSDNNRFISFSSLLCLICLIIAECILSRKRYSFLAMLGIPLCTLGRVFIFLNFLFFTHAAKRIIPHCNMSFTTTPVPSIFLIIQTIYIAMMTQCAALIPRFYVLVNRSGNEMHILPLFLKEYSSQFYECPSDFFHIISPQ